MRKLFIVAISAACLGVWLASPAFAALKTGMQKKADRNMRDRVSERSNLTTTRTGPGPRTVPYGTGVYKLVQ